MGYGPFWGLDFWEIIIIIWLLYWIFGPGGDKKRRRGPDRSNGYSGGNNNAQYEQALDACEEHIAALEERIRVLEEIVTDEHKKSSLADEIENLRQNT